jgi:hypothetical protein
VGHAEDGVLLGLLYLAAVRHPAPLTMAADPHRAHGDDARKEESSDKRIDEPTSMELPVLLPEHRCPYTEQAANHGACPADEGELPDAAAI